MQNPIAISPYYTNQTTEGFVDPGYKGTKIPDYKKIVLENVISTTPGDVLIAGIDDAHRTEITLNCNNVQVLGIKPAQVHLAYSDITLGERGTNLPLGSVATVKICGNPKPGPDTCPAKHADGGMMDATPKNHMLQAMIEIGSFLDTC